MNRAPVIAGVILLASVVSSPGQSAPRSAATPTDVPRTPWNVPDLQGRWTSATATPLQRPPELAGKEFFSGNEAAEYQKHALQRGIELSGNAEEAKISGEFVPTWMEDRPLVSTGRTSLIIGAEGRIPPLTADAQKRGGAAGPPTADNSEERSVTERCLAFPVGGPPMLPSILYNSNYEIVQTPTHLMIFAELGLLRGSFRSTDVRIFRINCGCGKATRAATGREVRSLSRQRTSTTNVRSGAPVPRSI